MLRDQRRSLINAVEDFIRTESRLRHSTNQTAVDTTTENTTKTKIKQLGNSRVHGACQIESKEKHLQKITSQNLENYYSNATARLLKAQMIEEDDEPDCPWNEASFRNPQGHQQQPPPAALSEVSSKGVLLNKYVYPVPLNRSSSLVRLSGHGSKRAGKL